MAEAGVENSDPTITTKDSVQINIQCREESYQCALLCQRCWKEGKFTERSVLCIECEHYLCAECGVSKAGDHRNHIDEGIVYNRIDSDKIKEEKCDRIFQQLEKEVDESSLIQDESDFTELPINVKMDDEKACEVTGMSVLPGRKFSVVDYINKSLKVIDRNENKIKRFKFSETPFDVAFFSKESLVAVTFPDLKAILIVDIQKDENQHQTWVPVNNKCDGIDSHEGKVFAISKLILYVITLQDDGAPIISKISLDEFDFKTSDRRYISVRSSDDIFFVENNNTSTKLTSIYRISINDNEIIKKKKYDVEQNHISAICYVDEKTLLLTSRNGLVQLNLEKSEITTPSPETHRAQVLVESKGILYVGHKQSSGLKHFITTIKTELFQNGEN